MSHTPRTDAVLMCMTYGVDHHSERYKAVIALARKLERELEAMTIDRDALADLLGAHECREPAVAAPLCAKWEPSGTDDLCRWCLAPKNVHDAPICKHYEQTMDNDRCFNCGHTMGAHFPDEDMRDDLPPCDRK